VSVSETGEGMSSRQVKLVIQCEPAGLYTNISVLSVITMCYSRAFCVHYDATFFLFIRLTLLQLKATDSIHDTQVRSL